MKRVYYHPGLISALVIPVLLWHFGNRKIEEITTSVVDISIPPKLDKDKSNYNDVLEPLRNWNLKKIEVSAGKAKENSDAYVSEVNALQQRNEKQTGIEFILGNENTYGDFVSLLNDMHISRHEEYAIDLEKTGNLLVPVTIAYPNLPTGPCELCDDVIYRIDDGSIVSDIPKPNLFEKTQAFFSHLTKEAYVIIAGFLILSYISILSFKERYQSSTYHLK
ncbi:Uncharacterised protein [Chryseobacterium nakagawai]|uniref:Uncharacterized protein n=1 Tax=Chryseobacterium nakagawai TaxID=1241982 RepID=A0AAD0YQH2_CHRNA|nr:hypothetical protein [Chryseobacterium nakagawai]AZA93145.1 hypothetical protein EG343_22335 [Chryseobacterium nakagawai]VEH19793.1 Uncharacterised protein [Chryseobacterium nakagawai]